MSAPNDHLSDENKKGKSANGKQNQDDMSSQILEHGDIFFFYRPKVAAREVTGLDDIRRFFMVTATDTRQPHTVTEGKTQVGTKDEHRILYRRWDQTVRPSLQLLLHGTGYLR